ncbi:type II toxin-antitoxin system HicB family antitoxin [uncultured Desulfuromusa sp.]|uniref:type II toxin-antitoxin system HicB family antitoxin n=1 Tax=uncultured Desulfuromusa sp. TaxID=219183 RepID=UPI002AA926D7|nr:type II toxin-antitoxin system HicB family antitoxin [uncultured Desulfuromusa sp.]
MNNVLKHKGFLGSINISIEDGIVFGKLLFINDLILYQAETVPALKDEFEAAVDDYIETCKQLNREPQKPCSGTFNVRIGSELHQKVAEYAVENDIKVNEVVKQSITQFLELPKKQEIVHNHIHIVRSSKWVSSQELSLSPSQAEGFGKDYDFTTNLQ